MRLSNNVVIRVLSLGLPVLGLTAAVHFAPLPVVAHPVCTDATAEGEYALRADGLTEDLGHRTANLGRIMADGHGRLSGELTVSINGRIATGQALSGTYSVRADCTGTESFTIGSDPTPRTASFVIANRGREIDFLETDSGTVFSGTATRQ